MEQMSGEHDGVTFFGKAARVMEGISTPYLMLLERGEGPLHCG
jgi:hypothetical protein